MPRLFRMGRPRLRNDQLKERLLHGALQLIANGGPAALTTRAVAASADSSISAVHELFGGKPGLIRAMFVQGFARLSDDLVALPHNDDPVAALIDLADAFRGFALEHRQLFEVMFAGPFAEFTPKPGDTDAAATIHRIIMKRVDALLGSTPSRASRKDAALAVAAVMQGLAHMELAGILGSGRPSIDRRWRTTMRATIVGLAHQHALQTTR